MRRYLTFDIAVHWSAEDDNLQCKECGLIGIDWGSVSYHLEEQFMELGADVDIIIKQKGKQNETND